MEVIIGALQVATSPLSASKSRHDNNSATATDSLWNNVDALEFASGTEDLRTIRQRPASSMGDDRAEGHAAEDAAAVRTDAMAEFREAQRKDHAALDDRLRRDRLNEIRELDILTSREGVIQESQMNELAELRELHERIIQAIHSFFDLKRELAGCQRQGPSDTLDNVMARLDQAEAEGVAAESSQHALAEPLVRGNGATIDQEVARLTGMLEQQTKELEVITRAHPHYPHASARMHDHRDNNRCHHHYRRHHQHRTY